MGPPKGRGELALNTTLRRVVTEPRESWELRNRPDIIKGYRAAVLTPNAMEFRLLAKARSDPERFETLSLFAVDVWALPVPRRGAKSV